MKPTRAVGAGEAGGTRSARGAARLPATSDQPAWLARMKNGFAGRVVDERDQPLAGALVVAVLACSAPAAAIDAAGAALSEGPAPSWFVDTTEADGRFVLPVLPPGRYTLFALHIGPPPATSEVMVVEGGFLSVPLRLVISRGAPIL
jgi:hypothetical protein